jgi:hypothetical protein
VAGSASCAASVRSPALPRVRGACARALAVPLEHSSSAGRAVARRRWYRPAREPLPPEPGRLVVCALLAAARRARGCVTPGDDRLETRVYAVKRYLFRLGHAARSARFATSVEQLVAGLAPVMGWGTPPRRGLERARFVRAHRKSVQRWLDDLQAAGLVAHEPERDQAGRWWRTQIVLLRAPAPDPHDLEVARQRARGWACRERRRHGRRVRSLAAIRRRSAVPGRAVRARLARSRAAAAHEHRRRDAVERAIAAARAVRDPRELLTHPFGAPPTSADPAVSPRRLNRAQTSRTEVPARVRSAQTPTMHRSFAAGTGAHARAGDAPALDAAPSPPDECGEEIRPVPPGGFDAVVLRRVAERERRFSESVALRRAHVLRRSQEVVDWPAGRACPLGRLREAWLTHRRGADAAAAHGTRSAGASSVSLARRVARAIALYEAFADERPPGWPATGPAALCALAGQRRAAVLAGDVARLMALAKGMRAVARLADEARIARAAASARRRAAPPAGPWRFRTRAARWESADQRRVRVRDELLLAGADPAAWPNAALAMRAPELAGRHAAAPELIGPDTHPELDGVGARAARYRAELANGRWTLPAGPDLTTTPQQQEDIAA